MHSVQGSNATVHTWLTVYLIRKPVPWTVMSVTKPTKTPPLSVVTVVPTPGSEAVTVLEPEAMVMVCRGSVWYRHTGACVCDSAR